MDTRLLQYYERELRLLRELGAPFARHFPKIAGRLAPEELTHADPYVERLLEGFAYMAARVHLKIDSEFPRFTSQLMELVYPHYLPPTPSMAIVQFAPDVQRRRLYDGVTVSAGTTLRAHTPLRDVTPCDYRTAHDVELWPIEIESAEYTAAVSGIAPLLNRAAHSSNAPVKALLRVRLRTLGGVRFDRLPISKLRFFLRGADEISAKLYEQLMTSAAGLWLRWGEHPVRDAAVLQEPNPLRAVGFRDDEALLPVSARTFQGYRLLQEYFAFPSRYDFVDACGLTPGMLRCNSDRLELLVPLTRYEPALEGAVDSARLCLFATPAINLFPRWCGRLPMPARNHELHVVPDRTRPLDYEVHSVTQVSEVSTTSGDERVFTALHAAHRHSHDAASGAHYTMERRARALSMTRRRYGSRTPYVGSEVFLTLSDPQGNNVRVPTSHRQLAVHALCTNRDLPLLLGLGRGGNDFSLLNELPVTAVRCITGPTTPRSTPLDTDHADQAFRLIAHLAPSYLSLCQEDGGAERLRGLLSLYAQLGDPMLQRQVSGIRSISATPKERVFSGEGPRAMIRGLEVSLTCEERAFSGAGVFTLASVLAAFFAKHAAINSFTDTVLHTEERGEVYRWPMTADLRHAS